MPIHINVAGVWKEVDKVHINVGGVWKECDDVPINVGGVWKTGLLVSGPSVSAVANGDNNSNFGTCYVGVQFNSSGVEYERDNNSTAYNVNMGNWLDSGTASEVWVEFIRTAGAATWDGKSNNTRYNLGTTQSFGLTVGGDSNSITGYFRFWDANTGGNILQTTSSVTWSATDTSV